MKKTFPILALLFLTACIAISAQKKAIGPEVKIQTSAQCEMCKERIEQALAFEKGVKNAILDLDTKVLTVWYSEKRTTPEKIRKAVANVGYDADEVKANPTVYDKLPGCCKKPDDPNHEAH